MAPSGSSDSPSQLWDVAPNERRAFDSLKVNEIRLSPDGTLLTSIRIGHAKRGIWWRDYDVQIWSLVTGETVHRLQCNQENIHNSVFCADNKLLVSASNGGSILLLDVPTQPSKRASATILKSL
jgi:WD40 repeat protein